MKITTLYISTVNSHSLISYPDHNPWANIPFPKNNLHAKTSKSVNDQMINSEEL